MHKFFLNIGIALAGLAVILGAFGAHGLKRIAPDAVPTFQTGVQYQMYHALALILVAMLYAHYSNAWMNRAGWLLLLGIILFSGSLYVLVMLKATSQVGLGSFGLITPIGGVAFIIGWLFLLIGVMGKK